MSKCRIRLILWLVLAGTSVIGGIVTDLILGTGSFPIFVRFLGLVDKRLCPSQTRFAFSKFLPNPLRTQKASAS
jgi:hypothetical protein